MLHIATWIWKRVARGNEKVNWLVERRREYVTQREREKIETGSHKTALYNNRSGYSEDARWRQWSRRRKRNGSPRCCRRSFVGSTLGPFTCPPTRILGHWHCEERNISIALTGTTVSTRRRWSDRHRRRCHFTLCSGDRKTNTSSVCKSGMADIKVDIKRKRGRNVCSSQICGCYVERYMYESADTATGSDDTVMMKDLVPKLYRYSTVQFGSILTGIYFHKIRKSESFSHFAPACVFLLFTYIFILFSSDVHFWLFHFISFS